MPDIEVPAEDIPGASPSPSVHASGEVPDSDLPEETEAKPAKEEKYGTGSQQAIAGLEGVAKGVAGPLATLAETKLLGVKPEDIVGREEANPWTHGIGEAAGLGGSLLLGTGEAALIGKVGEAAAGAAKLGKIGSTALKGALETGLFQGGDEISKYILGQSDPESPVSSALAHVGASMLLGGAGGVALGAAGSKLQQLAEGKTASKASQFLADFGNRWKFNTENPDLTTAITDELSHFHGSTAAAADEVYGASGLKDQAIQKLVPELNGKIASQSHEIATALQNRIGEMQADIDTYPPRLTKKFQQDVNQFMQVSTNPESTSHDFFNATQELKQKLQSYAKFEKQIAPFAPEKDFVTSSKELAYKLRNSLEDKEVWGQAAELQKGVNKAFSDFLPAQKDFLSKFTTKVEGEPVIDPGKIRTYVNQMGKPNAEIKQTMLENYVKAAEKYRERISDLHGSLGLESPLEASSLEAVKQTMGEKLSPGARAADLIFRKAPATLGRAGAHIAGSVVGGLAGGWAGADIGYRVSDHIAPIIEEGIGRRLTRAGVSGVLKALASGSYESVPQAVNYAESIGKGAKKVNSAVDNLFTIGGQKYLNHDFSETARESLKKYIADGNLNQEIENQKNQNTMEATAEPAQNFAHGGEVLAPEPTQPVSKSVKKVLQGTDHISAAFPEQSMLLGAAKGRINNYLNSIRPQSNKQKMAFDEEMHDKEHDRSYHRALDIANKPLSVIDHIKNGTLEPEHVKHLQELYPELSSHLQKKMMEKIVKAQMSNEKPPHKVVQGLSLFMGAPLDSNLTPQNIQAAQATFAMQKAGPQNAPVTKNKKNTSNLGKVPGQYRTSEQSLQARQSKV